VSNQYLEGVDDEYVVVRVIKDTAGLALLCGEFMARGEMLVCERCRDPGEIIVAILILRPPDGPSIAVCGTCFQLMPQGSAVT
jgi:hypothetical protein